MNRVDVSLPGLSFSVNGSKLASIENISGPKKRLGAEMGKVTSKSNGDKAFRDESLLKRNGDEVFNPCVKNPSNEAINASQKFK
jgi:hypothetical protein